MSSSQEMAQDDHQPLPQPRGPPPGATAPPDHVNKPQVYEIFHGSKPEDRNGSISTTPDGQKNPARPTLTAAMQMIKPVDLLEVPQKPCSREGLLTGIGSGFVVGMIRFIVGARIPKAANWAAGTFIVGSLIQYEVCQYGRRQERAAMARFVEVMDRKQTEKTERAAEAARLKAEAAEKARQAEARSWYKFW